MRRQPSPPAAQQKVLPFFSNNLSFSAKK